METIENCAKHVSSFAKAEKKMTPPADDFPHQILDTQVSLQAFTEEAVQ